MQRHLLGDRAKLEDESDEWWQRECAEFWGTPNPLPEGVTPADGEDEPD